VKALARKTHEATAGIDQQIEEVNGVAARSLESLRRLSAVVAGVDTASSAIYSSTDEQFASTRELSARVTEISASMQNVADDIRAAQQTAHSTELMSADVVASAAVIDEQADRLHQKIAEFVLQLRSTVPAKDTPLHEVDRGNQNPNELAAVAS
jgi:methyl-accepting chemotaxis protein